MFIAVSLVDFLGSLAAGVAGEGYVVFLGLGGEQPPLYGKVLPRLLAEDDRYVALGVSVFCALCAALVAPLCYVQLTNIYQNTTTHERFANPGHHVTST